MGVSFEVNCCGKAMLALGRMQTLDMSVRQVERWQIEGQTQYLAYAKGPCGLSP